MIAGADPGFFLGGGAPLRNDVTDRRGKQILKANMKASSQGGGGAHPLHPPPRSALPPFFGLQSDCCKAWAKGQHGLSRVQSLAWLDSLVLLIPRPQYAVKISH